MKKLSGLAFLALFAGVLMLTSCKSAETTTEVKDVVAEVCIDKDKINPDARCMKNYKPVCGCDGKTYSNACMADKAGVVRYTEGKCPE